MLPVGNFLKVERASSALHVYEGNGMLCKNKCRKFITKYSVSTTTIYTNGWMSSSAE